MYIFLILSSQNVGKLMVPIVPQAFVTPSVAGRQQQLCVTHFTEETEKMYRDCFSISWLVPERSVVKSFLLVYWQAFLSRQSAGWLLSTAPQLCLPCCRGNERPRVTTGKERAQQGHGHSTGDIGRTGSYVLRLVTSQLFCSRQNFRTEKALLSCLLGEPGNSVVLIRAGSLHQTETDMSVCQIVIHFLKNQTNVIFLHP